MMKLRLDSILEIIVWMVAFFAILSALLTGYDSMLIHPRYRPLLIGCLPILLMFVTVRTYMLQDIYKKPSPLRFIWLLFPLVCLIFLLPPINFNSQMYGGYVPVLQSPIKEDVDSSKIPVGGPSAPPDEGKDDKVPSQLLVSGSIPIDTAHYAAWLADVISNPSAYKGKTYTYLAQWDTDGMKKGEVRIGRPVIFCCAADAQVVGLESDYSKNPADLVGSDGEWYIVTAKIDLRKSDNPDDGDKPFLSIMKITKTDKPKNIFAYYYGSMKIPDVPTP